MRKLLFTLGLAFGAPVALASALLPCIKDGETATISEALPQLGPGSGTGLPVSAAWTSAPAQAWDVDVWSPNDFLDFAPVNGNAVSVDVTANGGSLWKNGQKIDSGIEGSCIEVVFRKSFTFTTTATGCIELSSGGATGKVCSENVISVTAYYCTKPQKACPC